MSYALNSSYGVHCIDKIAFTGSIQCVAVIGNCGIFATSTDEIHAFQARDCSIKEINIAAITGGVRFISSESEFFRIVCHNSTIVSISNKLTHASTVPVTSPLPVQAIACGRYHTALICGIRTSFDWNLQFLHMVKFLKWADIVFL